jgi:predicted NBD/HSP70 family sugar kinase
MPDARPDGAPVFSAQDLEVLGPLRAGLAGSRAELAKRTGLSPSTVTARVDHLIDGGHLVESGKGESSGGRRPRRLQLNGEAGCIGCVDIGIDRTTVALVDLAGRLLTTRHLALDIAGGPDAVLRRVATELRGLLDRTPAVPVLRGASIALPGPVSVETGRLVSPSRMPGWDGTDASAALTSELGVPAVAGNDANLMALGEYIQGGPAARDQVFVKAGLGIGCGIISGGALYTGSTGAAGDISHVAVPGAAPIPCSCGRTGCLDALASGSALARGMREIGRTARDVDAVIVMGRDGDPDATRLLREAGVMTGGVLGTIVNFFNPHRLVIGGALSRSDVFVSGVRSKIWADCLPMATDRLDVATPLDPDTGGIRGAGRIFLDSFFSTTRTRASPGRTGSA